MNIKWDSKWEDNHEMASMFDEEAHQWLSAELKRRMIAEASEP